MTRFITRVGGTGMEIMIPEVVRVRAGQREDQRYPEKQ